MIASAELSLSELSFGLLVGCDYPAPSQEKSGDPSG
jgi:hypothetical protein